MGFQSLFSARSIRFKIFSVNLGVALVFGGVVGLLLYTQLNAMLEKAALERLVAIRETKRNHLQLYFKEIQRDVALLAVSEEVQLSAKDFAAAYQAVERNEAAFRPRLPALRESLRQYYQQGLFSKQITGQETAALLPMSATAVLLQNSYLAANPHPQNKSLLETSAAPAFFGGLTAPYDLAHRRHHANLRQLKNRLGLYDLFIIHPQSGRILYTVEKEPDFATSLNNGPYRNTRLASLFRTARYGAVRNEVVMEDFSSYSPSLGAPAAFAGSQVWSGGKLVAIVAVQFSIEQLNKAVNGNGRWRQEGLGETGETLLVGDDLTLRNDSRLFLEDPEAFFAKVAKGGPVVLPDGKEIDGQQLSRRIQAAGTTILHYKENTPAVRLALLGQSGSVEYENSAGKLVLAAYAPVDVGFRQWALVAKMEEKEIFGQAWHLDLLLAFTGLLGAGTLILASQLLSLALAKPLGRLLNSMEAVRMGEFESKVAVEGGAEISRLAQSFNKMVDVLRDTTAMKNYHAALFAALNQVMILLEVERQEEGGWKEPTIQEVNGLGLKLLDYSLEELQGQPFALVLHQAKRKHPLGGQWVAEVMEGQPVQEVEVRLVKKKGELVAARVSISLVQALLGQPARLVCVVQDISRIKAVEEDLEKKRQLLAKAQEVAHLGYWEWELGPDRMVCSEEVYRLFGKPPHSFSVSLENFLSFIHPDDRHEFLKQLRVSIDQGKPSQAVFRVVLPQGEERYLYLNVEVDDKVAGNRRLFGTLQDNTQQLDMQNQLEVATRVFETAVEGVMVTDAKSVITYVNPAFTHITGYGKEEALGQSPRLLRSNHHPEVFYRDLWRVLEKEGCWKGEIWNRRKSGDVYPEWLSINAIKGNQGAVRQYIGVFHDLTELKQSEREVSYNMYQDPLTDLPNRSLFMDRLRQAISHGQAEGRTIALMLIGLDQFKHVNESLGPVAGDDLLKLVAKKLAPLVDEGDTLARLGGDEFAILLENGGQVNQAVDLAHAVLGVMNLPFQLKGHQLVISASLGIATFPHDAERAEVLLRHAGIALSRAKEGGRNQYQLFTQSMNAQAARRLELGQEIRRGLEQNQFKAYYQPKVDAASGQVVGMESLVRWQHPRRGLVSPVDFVPLAEENGMIVPMGWAILAEACRQNKSWLDQGISLQVAVNLSARQFAQPDLLEQVGAILEETGLPADKLELEVTESCVMGDLDSAVEALRGLNKMGITISMDDFGTGYSSLSYLKRLPIQKLKIDQSFVRDMHNNPEDASIVAAIMAMAKALSLKVVAEGVELAEHSRLLKAQGCHELQGYYFAKPLPAEEFEALIKLGLPMDGAAGQP